MQTNGTWRNTTNSCESKREKERESPLVCFGILSTCLNYTNDIPEEKIKKVQAGISSLAEKRDASESGAQQL